MTNICCVSGLSIWFHHVSLLTGLVLGKTTLVVDKLVAGRSGGVSASKEPMDLG